MKEENDKGAFGMLLVAFGIMIVIATEVIYTIFEVWEIRWGLVFGLLVMLVGIISVKQEIKE